MNTPSETAPRRVRDTSISRQASTEGDPVLPSDWVLAERDFQPFRYESVISGSASALPAIPPASYGEALENIIGAVRSAFEYLTELSTAEQGRSAQQPIPETIERSAAILFDASKGEEFEYGSTSQFALSLSAIVHRYGVAGIEAIQRQINIDGTDIDTTIEALHTLARVQHISTRAERLLLLLRALFATSPRARCGAALGLAYMDDPKALPFLRQAFERELSSSTRMCIQRVIEQLEDTERQS
jgi:hypothetical protein